jgi:signal peptidase I
LWDAIVEIGTTVALAVILYLIITTFVVQTFRVEQTSMLETLQPSDHLLIDKLTPRFDDYSRGDVVVFHPDGDTDRTPFIKRVIGLAGERVDIRDGLVWIDGVPLDEEYTKDGVTTPNGRDSAWLVPDGSLFVMGDNRGSSQDSRNSNPGFVETDDVVGRAWLRFFPIASLGILQTPEYPELDEAG